MKKIFILLFLLFFASYIHAQNEGNVWYFGSQAGLDFSSGSPVAITDGLINTAEGTATVCNTNGSILFYTDGITVWDKFHNIMPNGNFLAGGNSSTQSALISYIPGSNIYYIFTVQEVSSITNNLSYSIVDMSLNGGAGDVTVKNSVLISQASEKLNAIKNASNTGMWVMTHGTLNNSFYGYFVNASGLDTVPVISNIGQVFGSIDDNVGQLKFSPDGTKLAIAAWSSNFVELFDFNTNTGILSNNRLINVPSGSNGVYGLEFSPSNNFLYANNISPGAIYQWNINSNSAVFINNSIQQIGGLVNLRGALQLGPDGKIYHAKYNSTSLGVINNPDQPGALCDFVEYAIYLGGKLSIIGLPNYIHTSFIPTAINSINEEIFLHVFPNPFTSNVTIEIKNQNWKQVSFAIRNVLGQTIFNKTENNSGSTNPINIDLRFLSKGMYFLEVQIDEERIVRKMLKEL